MPEHCTDSHGAHHHHIQHRHHCSNRHSIASPPPPRLLLATSLFVLLWCNLTLVTSLPLATPKSGGDENIRPGVQGNYLIELTLNGLDNPITIKKHSTSSFSNAPSSAHLRSPSSVLHHPPSLANKESDSLSDPTQGTEAVSAGLQVPENSSNVPELVNSSGNGVLQRSLGEQLNLLAGHPLLELRGPRSANGWIEGEGNGRHTSAYQSGDGRHTSAYQSGDLPLPDAPEPRFESAALIRTPEAAHGVFNNNITSPESYNDIFRRIFFSKNLLRPRSVTQSSSGPNPASGILESPHSSASSQIQKTENQNVAIPNGQTRERVTDANQSCSRPCHKPDSVGICRLDFRCSTGQGSQPGTPTVGASIIGGNDCPHCHMKTYNNRCRMKLSCMLGFSQL